MTPIEVLAAIAAFAIIAKLVLWLCCPRVVIDWGQAMLRQPELLMVLLGIVAVVSSYIILQSIGIIPMMAVVLLASSLIKLSWIPYFRSGVKVLNDFPKTTGEVFARNWFSILIWGFLAAWTLFAVFG